MQFLEPEAQTRATFQLQPRGDEWFPNDEGTQAPHVSLHTCTRHVVITIDASATPVEDIRIEGRGDRMLVIWRQYRAQKAERADALDVAEASATHARALTLPFDVIFDEADVRIEGRKLFLRLPRQNAGVS